MEEEIIKKYTTTTISLEELGKEYKMGKLKLKAILSKHNIPVRSKGNQVKHTNKNNVPTIEPHQLSCKKCSKTFNDYENKSGSITNHIKECYPDITIPSSFKRRMFLKENSVHYHTQFFNKLPLPNKPEIKCPKCEWTTTDVDNKSGSLTKHVETHHSSISEFLIEYPDYTKYFNVFMKIDEREKELVNPDNFLICKICNEKLKTISNSHLKLHNMTQDEYKIKYGDVISKNLKDNYTERLSTYEISPSYRSEPENEIAEFIKSLNVDVLLNNKSVLNGTELDIYLPNHNIAIEYNGLYWHSEKQGKTKTYHLDKTIKCLTKNIRLIHIFSDEWSSRKDIIKSRIKTLLKLNTEKIYARKCEIVTLTKDDKKQFLDNNHLQGNDKSNIFYGLKYNGEIVSVLTFGKLRTSMGHKTTQQNEYELYRFSSLNVIGGFSKLLNHFINTHKPTKIITYSDRNWSPSTDFCFYNKMGFTYVGTTKPNYSYTKRYNKREHRYNYRKSKLIELGCDPNKSETQIMIELGFDRIWDTGNLKFEMNFN
jgi:hypothetical protein